MSEDDLINNGLEAIGFPRNACRRTKAGLTRLAQCTKTHLTEDELTRLIDRIEHNAEGALAEIRFWRPCEPGTKPPPPPEWLRPAWEMARYQYTRQTIVQWAKNAKETRATEDEAPRQRDIAKKLDRLSSEANSLVAMLQDPYVEQLVGDHIEVLRNKTLGKPGSKSGDKPPPVPNAQILERIPHKKGGSRLRLMLPEQSLLGLWQKPLVRCLEELALTAALVADPRLKDVGGSTTAWSLHHLPVKAALVYECWGLIDGLGFEKPTNEKVERLAQLVWELAGYGAGKSFERPLKQMRANIKEVTANEMLAGRHSLILSDPWAVETTEPE